jgi:uncharacterized membrane protein YoaK (UPF0700 family)
MTGNATRFGEQLQMGNMVAALAFGLLILCFFVGAFTASLIVDGGNVLGRGRYAAALFIEAAALATFGIMTARPQYAWTLGTIGVTGFLCFAMGLQNALVTRISGAVVRTTHLTGVITDLGIESVRLVKFALRNRRQLLHLRTLARDEIDYRIFKLHLAIFGSFLVGCASGPLLLRYVGTIRWLVVPLGMLIGLMVFDLTRGIGHKRPGPPPGADQPAAGIGPT